MRSSLFAVAATALVLAGCGQGEVEAPADKSVAAAPAVDPAAEAFVRSLYGVEAGGTNSSEGGNDIYDGRLWSARTAALVAQIETLTPDGEQGYFEANPFCACQDDSGMRLTSVGVTPRDADHADAAVVLTFAQSEPPQTLRQTYKLVREDGAWKVDDIEHEQGGDYPQPPLVQDLNRWIAEVRAEQAKA